MTNTSMTGRMTTGMELTNPENTPMQIEILGPEGNVHYRRSHTDPMILEALNTCHYSVFFPGGKDFGILELLPQGTYRIEVTPEGMRVHSRIQ